MNSARRILRVRPEPALGLLLVMLLVAGCGGGSASTPVAATPSPASSPISVGISPTSASVQTGQSATFTATVANDSAAKGVSWILAGTPWSVSSAALTKSLHTEGRWAATPVGHRGAGRQDRTASCGDHPHQIYEVDFQGFSFKLPLLE
jgi:hypothetical protein